MKAKLIYFVIFCFLFNLSFCHAYNYPASKRVNQIDNYHGTKVKDPYRWLEDLEGVDTKTWIASQNKFTKKYFDSIDERSRLEALLRKYWYYDRYSTPFQIDGKLFFQMNNILYVRDKEGVKPRVLVNPNKLSSDGSISLSTYSVSNDGKYLAYCLSKSGSDWQKWKVLDINQNKDTEDELDWIQYSNAAWTKDNKGFFYSRYDKPTSKKAKNYYHKLYYHLLGKKQSQDQLVFQSKRNKEWGFNGIVSNDGNFLVIHIWDGFKPSNRIYIKDLRVKNAKTIKLFDNTKARYQFVGNKGDVFWFKTNLNAPRGRLVSCNITKLNKGSPNLIEVVSQSKNVLDSVTISGGHFFCHYLKDASSRVFEYTASGDLVGEVKLPGLGSASGFAGGLSDQSAYYRYSSFNIPSEIYQYSMKSRTSKLIYQSKINFDSSKYVTKQIFVDSFDGTKLPLFITYKKGLKRNGNNPVFLFVYGGFGHSLLPSFSAPMIAWMELGGVYAQASLRGGGEYGEAWHQDGIGKKKQIVIKDCIACSKWLIENGYTKSKLLALAGRSNGALVAAAAAIQEPKLFGCVLLDSGLFDMLRFHKYTIGWSWVSEYGSVKRPNDFCSLYAYSPLHNCKKGTEYPSMLISTSINDERVVPLHSYKFCAQLQEAQAGSSPVLLRVESDTGHGRGKSISRLVKEWTDKFCFLYKELGPNSFAKY